MNKSIILEARQLSKRYTQGTIDVEVLKGVDIQIQSGERSPLWGHLVPAKVR